MKAHLLYRDRDFDWRWALEAAAEREATRTGRRHHATREFDPRSGLPWNADAVTSDLALETLFTAMARDDDCVCVVARRVILVGVNIDLDTISYRQDLVRDALKEPAVVRELYALAVEANQKRGWYYLGSFTRYPDSVLHDAIETMSMLLDYLAKLRRIAETHAGRFVADGWTALFATLKRDLDDEYLAGVRSHLNVLKFRNGELLSAKLGKANKGSGYVLHRVPCREWTFRDWLAWLVRKSTLLDWWTELFEEKAPAYSFELAPRDEAGVRALQELRHRGIGLAANALGQAADHVRNFFGMLRAELAFYVGCINLQEQLSGKGEPMCMPRASHAAEPRLSFRGLYDVGLALTLDRRVVGNDVNADGKRLLVITGPNTGGKSTFLRSIGLAQLMMQCGMFVGAESFCSSLCSGLFTHYKREEDVAMESGKFDEELRRMSEILDHIAPHSMILFNESFAATNEREGSEIARQIIAALLEARVRALCVTHMYELAHGFNQGNHGYSLFLRAARERDGVRTFKMIEGEPLPTSFGQDLYEEIFTRSGGRSTAPGSARAGAA